MLFAVACAKPRDVPPTAGARAGEPPHRTRNPSDTDPGPEPTPVRKQEKEGWEPAFVADLPDSECSTGPSCLKIGSRLIDATVGSLDRPAQRRKAFMAFRRGCQLDHPPACYEVAEQLPKLRDDRHARDRAQARRTELHVAACDAGHGRSCYRLGEDHHNTPQGASWYAKSVPLYRAACDKGDAEQCSLLAYNYREGRGVKKDRSRSAELLAQACKDGDGYSCDLLARVLVKGDGIPADPRRAEALFERACNLDPPYHGCLEVAERFVAAGETTKAVPWLRRGCPDPELHSDPNACRAREALCAAGIAEAC